ncbi:hypothetical protein M422DRAFT_45936 [Sphaerobolus stellatus SS14]|uniref:WSC domain-containing protein n=1 Tax=Sphaerobolus stellatus (strain SS14) TaxID=990650 RepID=A0A0C9VVJ9_SPHS4|nr:hypothetical protein M422DRAFT_45936 [Sphaerobolus stellatus SS14]
MLLAIKAPVLFIFLLSSSSTYATTINAPVHARQAALPSSWSAKGCFTLCDCSHIETASFTSVESMTVPSCINFCSAGGLDFAGIEFEKECYWDKIIWPSFSYKEQQ